MPTLSFGAQVAEWVRKVKGAERAVFLESVEEIVARLNRNVPVDTGFLRSSLVASTEAMPTLTRSNPGGSFTVDAGQIEAVISGSDIGETIYLGYTANYGAYVHYGAHGRPSRPWVALVAQQWPEIVAAKCTAVKERLGL